MKKVQVWCDQCGRELACVKTETGDGYGGVTNPDTTWEMWSKEIDWVFCSLLCLYHKAGNLVMAQDVKEANEDN